MHLPQREAQCSKDTRTLLGQFSLPLVSSVLLPEWGRISKPRDARAVTAGHPGRRGSGGADLISSVLSSDCLLRVRHSYQCLSLDKPQRKRSSDRDSLPRDTCGYASQARGKQGGGGRKCFILSLGLGRAGAGRCAQGWERELEWGGCGIHTDLPL